MVLKKGAKHLKQAPSLHKFVEFCSDGILFGFCARIWVPIRLSRLRCHLDKPS